MTAFAKVPPLTRADKSVTDQEEKLIEELFKAFYPLLPTTIEAEPTSKASPPVKDQELAMVELEQKVLHLTHGKL